MNSAKRQHTSRLSLRSDKAPYPRKFLIENESYSWIVLVLAFLLHMIIPSILASFGSFLLFDQIENVSHDNEFMLWDHEITQVPIAFLAFWTLLDPWSQCIVTKANAPRAVLVCGMCLGCCGFLITYAAELHEPSIMLFYILSGAVTGFGASLILQQCDSSIQIYFRGKLKVARNALYLGYLFGYIIVPFTLEKMIVRHGALETLLFYQAIFVVGIIIAPFFKAPKLVLPPFMKSYSLLNTMQPGTPCPQNGVANLLDTDPNEEIVIFSKEMKTFSMTENESEADKEVDTVDVASVDKINDTVKENGEFEVNVVIENGDEDKLDAQSLDEVKNEKTDENLNSIAITSASDDKTPNRYSSERFEPPFENYWSNSSDNVYHNLSESITILPTDAQRIEYENITNEKIINILMIPSFYKYTLLMVASKLSMITFWVLYPSLLYDQISYLNVHHTINNVTFITIGGLVFTVFWNCFGINKEKSKLFLALSFFLASVGFYVISSATTKNLLMFGGIISTTALASIHALIDTILLQSLDELKQNTFLLLNTVSGIIILIMVSLDMEYIECFQIMALIQLLTGSIWLSSVLFKKIVWLPIIKNTVQA